MPTSYLSPPKSPYLVPFDGSFRVGDARTRAKHSLDDDDAKHEVETLVASTEKLQKRLYAENRHAVLCVFQALDAAGKDSTIRAVTRGLNPAGCEVTPFKAPTLYELEHDFLWRSIVRLPERGQIGIHNRSHYEEVLTVRVHPEFLAGQRVPQPKNLAKLWRERLRSIRDVERYWARNGILVLKFWLHVSLEEQAKRLIDRIDEPESNWKFNPGDLKEREFWPQYMEAYEEALNATSRRWAPWYVIPADHKPTMRAEVARIMNAALEGLDPKYPPVTEAVRDEMKQARAKLENGDL